MFDHLSVTDLAVMALLLEEEEEETESVKRKDGRIWVDKSLKKWKTEGEFFTLYNELLDDEVKFHQYFRMSRLQFPELLNYLEEAVSKRNTSFREAITAKEKLAFGILAQRFRIFRRQLKFKPENVDKTVLASCTLHNYIKDASAISANQQDTTDEGALILSQLPRQGVNAPTRAFEIREGFRRFLNSPQGALPWST